MTKLLTLLCTGVFAIILVGCGGVEVETTISDDNQAAMDSFEDTLAEEETAVPSDEDASTDAADSSAAAPEATEGESTESEESESAEPLRQDSP